MEESKIEEGKAKCSKCHIVKNNSDFYAYMKYTKKKGNYLYRRPYCKQCEIDRYKKWSIMNPEAVKKKNDKYNADPKYKQTRLTSQRKGVKSGRQKRWWHKNKDKMTLVAKERYSNKKHDIDKDEWFNCKFYFGDCCAYCNMSLENHLNMFQQDLHRDHVDCNGANDLSNCVPSCKECNSSKKDRNFSIWYKTKSYYSDDRHKRILLWLKEDYKLYIREDRTKG